LAAANGLWNSYAPSASTISSSLARSRSFSMSLASRSRKYSSSSDRSHSLKMSLSIIFPHGRPSGAASGDGRAFSSRAIRAWISSRRVASRCTRYGSAYCRSSGRSSGSAGLNRCAMRAPQSHAIHTRLPSTPVSSTPQRRCSYTKASRAARSSVTVLLDHLIRPQQERLGDRETEGLRDLQFSHILLTFHDRSPSTTRGIPSAARRSRWRGPIARLQATELSCASRPLADSSSSPTG
jgi:hypothetical protein